MLGFIPSFYKQLASLDPRLAKHILIPKCQPALETGLFAIKHCRLVPLESYLSRAKEGPCVERTRLGNSGIMSEFDQDDSESAVYVEVKDVSFDDGECVAVDRSPTIFQKLPGSAVATTQNEDDIGITKAPGPHALSTLNDTTITSEKDERFQITTPSHPIFPGAFLPPVDDSQDGGPLRRKTASDPTTYDQSAMETMNLPFAQTLAQLQQKSYTHHEGDADNLSIVSNASRIPTYMGFHQRRGRNFRKLVQEKAKPVAKQTVERCRQVAEKLLAEWREPKGMKCVPVGEEL